MTKVGILTLNGSDNYGNVLQNYALQEILKDLGVQAETIQNKTQYGHYNGKDKTINKFTPSYVRKYYRSQLNYRYNIKNTGVGLGNTVKYYKNNENKVKEVKEKRKKVFKEFTDKYIYWSDDEMDINVPWTGKQVASYDYYVTGSDQVWNPVYPSTSSINFLQFAPKEKRIAFSPSFGVNDIPEDLHECYAKWLKEIPYLSVREEQGKKIIKDLCGRDAIVLCDPTIALKKEKWLEIEQRPAFLKTDKYLLTYFLGDRNKEYDKYISQIAKENGLQEIHLYDVMQLDAYSVSPCEFIYLIKNAKLVCTDSFHGAVFSIIMNTNFVTFPRIELGGSMESRMITLLNTFSLKQRDYRILKKEEIFKTDFSIANVVAEEKRLEAISFLKAVIETEAVSEENNFIDIQLYTEKKDCCGCNACATVCPVQCISLEPDEEGFLYPVIDNEKCIKCGKCQKVCPTKKTYQKQGAEKICYVGYSADAQIRRNSSSGGLFTEFATNVLNSGGTVFGAAFDKDFCVVHQGVSDESELSVLRGSKYVQSSIGDTYKKAKEILKQGKKVYFSGTPCQIKGLYLYLGNDKYENLYTQDIVCHGVPSPKVWEKYVSSWRDKQKIDKISFRDKKYGWHYFSMMIQGEDKCYRKRLDEDWYLRLFLDNTILRPICHDCPLKKEGSCADITLADCWNPTSVAEKLKDTDEGLSLIILNTPKGSRLWENIVNGGRIVGEKVDTQKAMSSQSSIYDSVKPNAKRAIFFEGLNKKDFSSILDEWYRDNGTKKIKRSLAFYKTKIYVLLKKIGMNF